MMIRVFVVLLSVSISTVLSHRTNITNGASTAEELRRAVASSIRTRSLPNIPVGRITHIEPEAGPCSKYCEAKAGNAVCNGECYTMACAFDFADCSHRHYRPCHELRHCSSSRCSSDCHLSGCSSGCNLTNGDYNQLIFLFSPYISPMRMFDIFPTIEERIHQQTGLVLKLIGLYGLVDGSKHELYAKLPPLYPIRNSYNQSYSIYKVERGYLNPKDEKTLDVLKRLGTDRYYVQVTPMILSAPQIEERFEPYASTYEYEREKLQMEKEVKANYERKMKEKREKKEKQEEEEKEKKK